MYPNNIPAFVLLVERLHSWRQMCCSVVYELRLACKTYFGPEQMLEITVFSHCKGRRCGLSISVMGAWLHRRCGSCVFITCIGGRGVACEFFFVCM